MPYKSLSRRGLGAFLWGLGFGLAALPVFLGLLNYDVSWFLCAADSVLAGRRLYVDIMEINPPLIVWLNFAPVLIARRFDLSEILVFRSLMLGVLAGSLLLSAWVMRRADPESVATRRLIHLLLIFAILPLVGYDFGQREHLMLSLFLPYLLLASARVEARPLGVGMTGLVGLLAGVGISLKPHFVLLWLAIEMSLTWARGSWRIWLRPESIAVVLVGATYGAAILVFTPEYPGWLRWITPVYSGCSRASFLTLLSEPATRLSLVALLGFLAIRPRGEARNGCLLLLVANLTSLGIAFLQDKGYSYHFYPPLATALILVGCLALGSPGSQGQLPRFSILLMKCVFAMIVINVSAARIGESLVWRGCPDKSDTVVGRMIRYVRANARSGSLYTFSPAVAASFPLVSYGEVRWEAGHTCLLFLPYLYPAGLQAEQARTLLRSRSMGHTERFLFEMVVSELLRNRPTLLLVDAREKMPAFNGRRFDYLAYYSLDPRFAEFMKDYERIADVETFRGYRRKLPTLTQR